MIWSFSHWIHLPSLHTAGQMAETSWHTKTIKTQLQGNIKEHPLLFCRIGLGSTRWILLSTCDPMTLA